MELIKNDIDMECSECGYQVHEAVRLVDLVEILVCKECLKSAMELIDDE